MSEEQTEIVKQIFEDFEARSNIVGLFDLLLKIDKRVNPQLYKVSNKTNQTND